MVILSTSNIFLKIIYNRKKRNRNRDVGLRCCELSVKFSCVIANGFVQTYYFFHANVEKSNNFAAGFISILRNSPIDHIRFSMCVRLQKMSASRIIRPRELSDTPLFIPSSRLPHCLMWLMYRVGRITFRAHNRDKSYSKVLVIEK